MSSVPSMPELATRTPRKRKAVETPLSPPSTRRKRTGAAPIPNPPLVPFPTPSSRHRAKGNDLEDPEVTPKASASASFVSAKPRAKLPDHLQTLLTLHHAFNIAISLHLATQPPVLPPHSADATSVRLPNLTNLLTLKGAVERGSGRRFGQAELARLAWLYAWDGESLPKEDKDDEDDNPFLDKPKVNPSEPVSGLSYLITATRTLDPTGRKVHTLGIGLELDIEAGETRQLLMGGAEGGFGNKGQGGGLRVVGRWNAGAELREDIVRSRLEKWVMLHGGELEIVEDSHLPTPSTRDSGRSAIPPIPLLPLPKLASANLGAALFAASPSTAESGPSTPKPPAFASELSDPFEMPMPKAPMTPKGSIEARRQALRDRIRAKSASAKAAKTPFANSIRASMETLSRAQQQEELQRRSTLSRLEPIAESVWMMFSGPSSGPLTLSPGGGLSPARRRKAIPLSEAVERIVKSARSPLSAAEAEISLRMLADLCPFFVTVKLVGKHDWIEMPNVQVPSSPGSGLSATAAEVATSVLGSPTRSPRTPRALAGPASPGRVQVGGLRAVRERIRRELGE